MAFKDETSSFFDELTNIIDEQQQTKDDGRSQVNDNGDAPAFSSMLLQDEEPGTPAESVVEEVEPEIITRQGI